MIKKILNSNAMNYAILLFYPVLITVIVIATTWCGFSSECMVWAYESFY